MNHGSFFKGLLHFFIAGFHFFPGFQANDGHGFGSQSAGGAGTVKSYIAATQNHDVLADFNRLAKVNLARELGIDQNAVQVVTRNGQFDPLMSADGDQHRIEPLFQQFGCRLDTAIGFNFHADLTNLVDFLIELRPRQAIFGDADPQHTAGKRQGLENCCFMSQLGQIKCRGQTGGAGTDDGNFFPVSAS